MDVVLVLQAISVFPVSGRKKLNDVVTTATTAVATSVLKIGLKKL